jgi:hypothetical protein
MPEYHGINTWLNIRLVTAIRVGTVKVKNNSTINHCKTIITASVRKNTVRSCEFRLASIKTNGQATIANLVTYQIWTEHVA